MHKKRNGYYDDIEPSRILRRIAKAELAMIVMILVVTFTFWVETRAKGVGNAKYNVYAEEYNSHSAEERDLIRPFIRYEYELDLETNTLPLAEENRISFLDYIIKQRYLIIPLLVITYSLAVIMIYGNDRDSSYHFGDIPLNGPYGWFLLISMFLAWPWFIAYRLRSHSEEGEEKTTEDKQTSEKYPPCSEKDYRKYVADCIEQNISADRATIEELDGKVAELEEKITELGETLRTVKQQRNATATRLREFTSDASLEERMKDIPSEWDTLSNMPNVTKILIMTLKFETFSEDGCHATVEWVRCLAVMVKIRHMLQGKTYDLGYYAIYLSPTKYGCVVIPSGLLPDPPPSQRLEQYKYMKDIVFSEEQKEKIESLLKKADFVGATTLMIEYLDTPSADIRENIADYFQEISEG